MISTLRTRLLIGIAPLLAIMVALGLWAVVMFMRLGGNIDVILRENYKSVLAAERMKEALERLDSALMFALNGEEERAHRQFREHQPAFAASLDVEVHNITLLGEQEMADDLSALYRRYLDLAARFFDRPPSDVEGRRRLYFGELLPLFGRIKDRADDVLNVNQRNMEAMDRKARAAASGAVRGMVAALVGAAAVASLIALLLSRSILRPIRGVTAAARAMAEGDLEQVVPVLSRDELGELAEAFNSLATTIRAFQQAGTARLLRAQRTAQATIDSFPDPVVVVDPAGAVERANPAARRLLGVHPVDGATVAWDAPGPLETRLADVLKGGADYRPTGFEHAVTLREDGQERHLLPRVLAIRDEQGGLLGAAVVLNDVTRFRILDQLKSDMVATVSHELKTPLTSIQMAVHLLLEEVVGPLTAKQLDLLLAARQDSDRLLTMINDLLDLTRIEQGSVRLDPRPVLAAELVAEAVDRFADRAHDLGIHLAGHAAPGLPEALVDRDRITHVFDNLIDNALAHTERGGAVLVRAEAGAGALRFTVEDNGEGIAAEHLPRIFDRFYRVPGSRSARGVGLGLAIAREVVAAHGGQIDVASAPGSGTTFTITLPVAPSGDGKGAP